MRFVTKISGSLSFSGHETFPLRQMWLKKVVDMADEGGVIEKKKFSDPEQIAKLGVGKNMLSSMKHWSIACGMLKDSKSNQLELSNLAKDIFLDDGYDPYSEKPITQWLLHWELTKSNRKATTIFYLFNRIRNSSFSKAEVKNDLLKISELSGKSFAEKTIEKDIDVSIKSYASTSQQGNEEDLAEPIFTELGLLNSNLDRSFSFNRGPKPSLNKYIFIYFILDYLSLSSEKRRTKTLSLEELFYEECSPGLVAKLDENSVIDQLENVEEVTNNRMLWSKTAGLRQLMVKDCDLEVFKSDMLRGAYEYR